AEEEQRQARHGTVQPTFRIARGVTGKKWPVRYAKHAPDLFNCNCPSRSCCERSESYRLRARCHAGLVLPSIDENLYSNCRSASCDRRKCPLPAGYHPKES